MQGRFSKGLNDTCLIFDIFRSMSMSDWMQERFVQARNKTFDQYLLTFIKISVTSIKFYDKEIKSVDLQFIIHKSVVLNEPLRCNFQRFSFDYPVNGLCEDANQFCLDNLATTTTTTTSTTSTTTTTTSTTIATTTASTTTTTAASNVEILDGADCWFRCFGSGKYFYDAFYILYHFLLNCGN